VSGIDSFAPDVPFREDEGEGDEGSTIVEEGTMPYIRCEGVLFSPSAEGKELDFR